MVSWLIWMGGWASAVACIAGTQVSVVCRLDTVTECIEPEGGMANRCLVSWSWCKNDARLTTETDGAIDFVEILAGTGSEDTCRISTPTCRLAPFLPGTHTIRGTITDIITGETDTCSWTIFVCPAIVYVDHRHIGQEVGTQDRPFNTVAEGVNTVRSGGEVRIAGGSYPETMTINKALTLTSQGGTVDIGGF